MSGWRILGALVIIFTMFTSCASCAVAPVAGQYTLGLWLFGCIVLAVGAMIAHFFFKQSDDE